MPASPPPIVHVGKKKSSPGGSPTAVASSGHHSRSAKGLSIHDDKATIFHKSLQGKTFVQKIHAILEVPKYSSIISWNDAGDVATIYDSDAFISEIVPLYFKKCKFGSFIRKMRRWGFSALTKKRGQKSVIAFSSEYFLRDRPDLCLLMKDERHVKRQFEFLDRNVKNANHEENIQPEESSEGVHDRSSSPSSNVNAAATNYQTESNPDIPISPMVSPNQQSFHNPMQMMNMMMPPTHHHHLRAQQQLHYPSCGRYGAPLSQGGVGFRPQSPMFHYPAGYSSFPHEEVNQHQHQQMMHQNNEQHQQQNLLLQQQYLMMQQQMNQHSAALLKRSPVSVKREAAKLRRSPSDDATAKASTANAQSGSVAVLTSSSEETTELVPNAKSDERSELS